MGYLNFFIWVLTGSTIAGLFPQDIIDEETEEDVQREIENFLLEFPKEERETIKKLCLS